MILSVLDFLLSVIQKYFSLCLVEGIAQYGRSFVLKGYLHFINRIVV